MNIRYQGYSDWKNISPSNFGSLTKETSLYHRMEFAKCGLRNPRGLRILEIGFGGGQLATFFRELGAIYVGTEANDELIYLAQRHGFRAFPSHKPFHEYLDQASLDLVVGFDVFEHMTISEFMQLLQDIRLYMNEDAILVGRVPSGDSPFSLPAQNGDVTHQAYLGSSAIHQIAQRQGFDLVAAREPALPLFGLGLRPLIRRAALSALRAFLHPLLRALIGGGKPVLTPALLFVLKKNRSIQP